ncbi:MAG: aconitase X catalytic domain-containing protein [Alphaproteobacteria bacterium]|nr:aconitase X catalytic domain-containing protein [Alphaproteobacteria bacterium]
MRLDPEERAMLAGEMGPARRFAMRQIVAVGAFFDAEDCVPVAQVHLMADPESLGDAGVGFLEELAVLPAAERRVVVPTVTDPRGVDFESYRLLGQTDAMAALERRTIAAFEAMGILLTNTCINYQTVLPPVLGEHLAFGDTGSSIYANSVAGARTNFEGGPSALAAALTGRTSRYGYHLDRCRRGGSLFRLDFRPEDLSEWGTVGALIGREMRSYWEVPVIVGVEAAPTSDQLKQFGAALASFGSTPLFHMVGVTPEAPSLAAVFDGLPPAATAIDAAAVEALRAAYRPADDRLDVVVFSAPQLSLLEMRTLAGLLDGRQVHGDVTLLAATSPEVKAAADRLGLSATIEAAGGRVLQGVCFYQMYAREIGEVRCWRRLMTNSAKLTNIIGGYGYEPYLASMEACVESAVQGRIVG